MMLKAEQKRLYDRMCGKAHCFVKVCDDDSALWVSDFPRRHENCHEWIVELQAEGYCVRLDEKTKLCYLDWTIERWQERIASLPQKVPPLPEEEMYHETFALCRLWMMHPEAFEAAQLPVLRRVVKLIEGPPEKLLHAVRNLYEEAAVQLREGRPMTYAAGRALAAWLCEHAYRKEMQP